MQIDPKIQEQWKQATAGREPEFDTAATNIVHAMKLMGHLRSASGCPWDREQSLASLRQYVREEADEVCHAIDRILDAEAQIRQDLGLDAANPDQPEGEDKARTEKKGLTIAHHPHRDDFDPAASAAGAPLPQELPADKAAELQELYLHLAEELGDLLLQPLFQADIMQAMGRQTLPDMLELLVTKLIRRHPHVYGDTDAGTSAEVLANWEVIKQQEKQKPGAADPEL